MYPYVQNGGEAGDHSSGIIRILFVLLVILVAFPQLVSADTYVGGIPLQTVQSGVVSGGLYMDANNTWWPSSPGPQAVTKAFATIPEVDDIVWARLYVAVYCGHMQNNYQGTVVTTFDGNGDGAYETVLGTEKLNVPFVFITNGGNDNSAFPGHAAGEPYKLVNNHANRVTSDYLMWYDVTGSITGPKPRAHVVTSAVSGSFDGRIKLITLVVAYNDGDEDTVYYWVNQGHDTDTYYSTTDYVGSTEFDLSGFSGIAESATLMVNHMASEDGHYTWLGDELDRDPAGGNGQGAYFGYNIWNMTTLVYSGYPNDLTYDRYGGTSGSSEFGGQFYKIPLALLSVRQSALIPPVADFSADPVSGETPFNVTFTDASAGPPSSWIWEYRYKPTDGVWGSWIRFATIRNPSHTFTDIGTYTIRLTATNDLGSDSAIKTGYIIVTEAAPPVAAFTAIPTSGPAPLSVTFTDQSTGKVTGWAWDFENDGIIDNTTRNPEHTFTMPGTYDVRLSVTGPGGSDDEIRPGFVTISEAPPVAGFSATPRSGYPPLNVTFTDLSAGNITSWEWDVDNNGTVDSTEQNPVYNYTIAGTYTVRLQVTGPGGKDEEIKTDYIQVSATAAPPTAGFSANLTKVGKNELIQFSDQSVGMVTVWAWDFNNDGITDSTVQDPVHAYESEGSYTVSLAVGGPYGADTEAKIDYIKVRGDPHCDLTITGPVNPINLGSTVFAREPNTIRIIGIKNNGPSESPATTIELAASDGFTARGEVPALPSGANTTLTIIDTTVRPGAGTAIRYNVTIDPDDDTGETDETNNSLLSAEKIVTYNGYKGKRYGNGGDISTSGTFDLNGGLVHSFGDSVYRSGSFGGSGWTSYAVTWSPADLQVPENATIKRAVLYVPYTWDNSNAAESISVSFNGESQTRGSLSEDRSNFGAYADYDYGLLSYDVTSSFRKNGRNTADFSRGSANAKLSMYGFTLAVIYEDAESSRKQIFLNEGFDLLGADETNYGTNPEEATAYVPFTGLTVDPQTASRAELITFVASGDGEGTLLFNGVPVGGGWDFGSISGPQVAVATYDIRHILRKTGNVAALRSTPGETPAMGAVQQFLVVDYGKGTVNQTEAPLHADFSAEPLNGTAPLIVNFTDLSAGTPVRWAWDFEDDGRIDASEQNPHYIFYQPGSYTVNLTVWNTTAFDSVKKTGYVLVLNATTETEVTTAPPTEEPTAPDRSLQVTPGGDAVHTPGGDVNPPPPRDPVAYMLGLLSFVADRISGVMNGLIQNLPFMGSGGTGG